MSGTGAGNEELTATPGERLRQARERRALSRQQAAEQLNLDVTVIDALEHDDFAALGAPVFAKGHLRKYAALLELPGDELLHGYERSRAQPAQPSLVPKARVEMQPQRNARRWPLALGSLLVFLLAAAAFAWFSDGAPGLSTLLARLRGEREPATSAVIVGNGEAAGSVGAAAPPRAPLDTPSDTSPEATATATGINASPGDRGSSGPAPANLTPGQVSVQIRFVGDSWVEVYDASGKAVLYDLGRTGTDRVVSGQAPLSVTLGNSPAVQVSINGRSSTLPTPAAGTVLRFGVNADGTLR